MDWNPRQPRTRVSPAGANLVRQGLSPSSLVDSPRGWSLRECTTGRRRGVHDKPRVPAVSLLDASRLDQVRPRPRDGIILVRVDAEDEGRGILVFPGPELVVVVVP